MNIKEKHSQKQPVSAKVLFQGEEGKTIALQILKDQVLKEHITKIPAMLICMSGQAIFEDENGIKETLVAGDYIEIPPMVKHWVKANIDSQLILMK